MVCPLCGTRRARRSCPAVGQQICAICCGTKRLVEIQCPDDCPYLASAREHPAASTIRRRHQDVGLVLHHLRDLNERQTDLFFLVNTFLLRYEAPELQPLIDIDVAEAAGALARTFETASRGVIYDHRPASLPADRLATALKPLIAEAGKREGSSFERDAAVVLRRVEEAARDVGAGDPSQRRAYIDLVIRVMKEQQDADAASRAGEAGGLVETGSGTAAPPPRLIVE